MVFGRGSLTIAAAAAPLFLAAVARANCAFGPFVEAYSPERCWLKGDTVSMKCADKWNSASCGMRLNALGTKVGAGQWSMTIKAAPGFGAVTTFYLSNNGGMYDLNKPWNEIDFEIMGGGAWPKGSKIWTNLFTGHMDEHNAIIEVPFDVSADFHTYTFDVSETAIKWMVDGVAYRTQEISAFPDAQNTIRSWAFRPFISFWGKGSKDPELGVPEFRKLQGKLDWNRNPFPLIASFKSTWNPPVPEAHTGPPPDAPACGPTEDNLDYVVDDKWFKTLSSIHDKESCCSACQEEPRCKSWTVVLESAKFAGECWLKGGLPTEKKKKAGVVSGLPHPDGTAKSEKAKAKGDPKPEPAPTPAPAPAPPPPPPPAPADPAPAPAPAPAPDPAASHDPVANVAPAEAVPVRKFEFQRVSLPAAPMPAIGAWAAAAPSALALAAAAVAVATLAAGAWRGRGNFLGFHLEELGASDVEDHVTEDALLARTLERNRS